MGTLPGLRTRRGPAAARKEIEIPHPTGQPAGPFVLVIEPDATTARRIVASLGRDGRNGRVPARRAGGGAADRRGRCVVIGTLRELFEQDLGRAELVICSVNLPDGTGLNALDYLRGHWPRVPVIIVGDPADASVAVEAIRGGAVDFLTTTGHDLEALQLAAEKCLAHQRVKLENERLHRDLSTSLTELAVRNQQLQALVRQLEATARIDDLTGLCNRRSLNEMLERVWQQAVRENRPLAFMMIDLDDFKQVNDRLGHQFGDHVLRRTGRLIQANCRQGDVPARYGGDEFCVLMPECDAVEAVRVAQRLLRACEKDETVRIDAERSIGLSIGVAHLDRSSPSTYGELIRHADEALYAAKAAGKRRIMVRDHDGVHEPPPPERVKVARGPAVTW